MTNTDKPESQPAGKPETNTPQAIPEPDSTSSRVGEPTATESRAVYAKPKGGGKGLSLFAILISLLALGGSGYTLYQAQVLGVQKESRLAVGVSEIGAQVTRIGDAVARLKEDQSEVVSNAELGNRLLQFKSTVDEQVRTISGKQQVVEESVQGLRNELQRGVDQFTVEEVSQLLRLANNSILFGNNIEAAVNALTLADEQLKGLRDPRYAPVRTQINTELAVLRGVTLPDVEALSAQLNTLAKEVGKLPLANEPVARELQSPIVEVPDEAQGLRGEFVKIWRDLLGSISIQRVDQPPKPLLVPEQRYFLNENISLALSKAELALLQGEADIYQRSLADAQLWLREYFDLTNADVQNMMQQIAVLQGQNISVEIPAITGSFAAMQSVLGGQ